MIMEIRMLHKGEIQKLEKETKMFCVKFEMCDFFLFEITAYLILLYLVTFFLWYVLEHYLKYDPQQ